MSKRSAARRWLLATPFRCRRDPARRAHRWSPFWGNDSAGAQAGAIAGNGRRQTETVGDRVCSPSEMTAETNAYPAIRPCVHWGSRGPGFKSRQPDKKTRFGSCWAETVARAAALQPSCNRSLRIDIPRVTLRNGALGMRFGMRRASVISAAAPITDSCAGPRDAAFNGTTEPTPNRRFIIRETCLDSRSACGRRLRASIS